MKIGIFLFYFNLNARSENILRK